MGGSTVLGMQIPEEMALHLPPSTLLVLEVGSTAHGTGLPGGEDLDLIAVYAESPQSIFALDGGDRSRMYRTQPEGVRSGPGDTDLTVHPLRKFLHLAAAGNPSILMCFWAPVLQANPWGEMLQETYPWFIGRHVVPKYRGYMRQQGLRMLGLRGSAGHGRRGGGQREELIAEHGYDTKFAMHAARLGYQCIELLSTERLQLPMRGEAAEWLLKVRQGEIPFDEWWERCLELDAAMERLQNDTEIRPGPERNLIVAWSRVAHEAAWRENSL